MIAQQRAPAPRRRRPERKPVPTAHDLVRQGLAQVVAADKKGKPTTVHITPEGHALLGEIMRHNGRLYPMTTTAPCPVCLVPAGEPCTRPTSTGRVPITYLHMARTEEPTS